MQFYDHQLVGIGSDADLFTAHERRARQAGKAGGESSAPSGARKAAAPTIAGAAEPDDESAPAGRVSATSDGRKEVRVFRVNHHEQRKPMTLEEAMLEMEDDRDYLVYRDADKECVSVLVRRRDGNFDLIES